MPQNKKEMKGRKPADPDVRVSVSVSNNIWMGKVFCVDELSELAICNFPASSVCGWLAVQ